jgi:hypothetical protein
VSSTVASHTVPHFDIPHSRDEALNVLEKTERFADVAIGLGGAPSAEVCAFSILMRQPDATQLFARLVREAGDAGQLYALSGLYLLDHARYVAELPRFETSEAYVSTEFGCIVGGMKASDLVHAAAPRELDIASGGYPERFATFTGCPK